MIYLQKKLQQVESKKSQCEKIRANINQNLRLKNALKLLSKQN